MMVNRVKWNAEDAEAVAYLLTNRRDELDEYEAAVCEGLAKKRPYKDTISVNQRIFFDELWERKAPGKTVTP